MHAIFFIGILKPTNFQHMSVYFARVPAYYRRVGRMKDLILGENLNAI